MLPHICVFFPLPLSLALISSDFLFLHTNDAALYENWMELEPVTTILKAHIWTLYTKQRYKVMLDLKQKHTTFQLSPPPPVFSCVVTAAAKEASSQTTTCKLATVQSEEKTVGIPMWLRAQH